jgi:hypothetical protein
MIADLLEPQNEASFFADIYEKKHLLIARNTNDKLVRNCNNLFNKGERTQFQILFAEYQVNYIILYKTHIYNAFNV